MKFYDSPQATVSWNETVKAVVIEWKGFALGEQYRTPLNKLLELAVQKQSNKVLYDTRKLSAISPDDQNWVAQDWYARSLEAGLKYSAAVIPIKVIAKSSLNRMVSGLEVSNPSEEFDDIDEAIQWLSAKK
ncbi:hypothetical protein ACFPPD_10300 [Cohnella suwonensis]|uniref:STAS/SEC14 domain-containing protein n=1 Tax=Cohnella suwonensis TaxID=696072 RepID=A0ABW0LX03_9BACL